MTGTTWTHRDPNPTESVRLGYEYARAGSWNGRDRVRALRGLAIESAWLQAWFAKGTLRATTNAAGETVIEIDATPGPSATLERLRLAGAIYGTWRQLALEDLGASNIPDTDIGTPNDTGVWPLAVAAIVVGVAACAAIAYGAYQAAQVIDRKLSRDADTQKLVTTHAATLALLREHADREQAAGKDLPLDAPTTRALESLLRQQETIAKKSDQPLSSGVPGTGLGWSGGLVLAAIAAAAIVGHQLLK